MTSKPGPRLSNAQAKRIIAAAQQLPEPARLEFEKDVVLRLRGVPSDASVADAIKRELASRHVPGFLRGGGDDAA